MNCPKLSEETSRYLSCYNDILDTMIRKMTQVPLTQSISHNFIVQMIPHHEAAIEMSRNLLRYTSFEPLKDIAQSIIETQTESIKSMRDIFEACQKLQNTQAELSLYQARFRRITDEMFCKMKNAAATDCINANFIREMIPHHEGAIQMSKSALQFPICDGLKPILEDIIFSQEKGVCQMKELLGTCK